MTTSDITTILEFLNEFKDNDTVSTLKKEIEKKIKTSTTTYVLEYIMNYEGMREGTQYQYFDSLQEFINERFYFNENQKFDFILDQFELSADFDDIKYDDELFQEFDDIEELVESLKNTPLDERDIILKLITPYIDVEGVISRAAEDFDYSSYSVYTE